MWDMKGGRIQNTMGMHIIQPSNLQLVKCLQRLNYLFDLTGCHCRSWLRGNAPKTSQNGFKTCEVFTQFSKIKTETKKTKQ